MPCRIPSDGGRLAPATTWWRQWHRWIGWAATAFILFAGVTGVAVAVTEFFGEEEAQREATRGLVSEVTTSDPVAAEKGLEVALAAAAREAPGSPIDQITLQLKGPHPRVAVFLGKPGGGEDRRLEFDLATGTLIRSAAYVDKPLINRVHSGEVFGDGGLVAAMMWGVSLIVVTISGIVIYWSMRRKNARGIGRYFW